MNSLFLWELCEKAIANATKALRNGDLELAKLVMSEDEEIDQIEKDIERLCLKTSASAAAGGKRSS